MVVEELGGFSISFEFGNVANVVECESVVRIEGVSFAEIRIRCPQIISVHGGNATQIQLRNLLAQLVLMRKVASECLRVLLSHLAHLPSSPSFVGCDHGSCLLAGGSLVEIPQSVLLLAFHLFRNAEIV